ncbi:MAG: DNA recombination protein RmuC [Microthrixaceae bacterium]
MDTFNWIALAISLIASICIAVVATGWVRGARSHATSRSRLEAQLEESRRTHRTEDQLLDAVRALTSESLRESSRELLALASQRHQQVEESAHARWDTQGRLLSAKLDEYSQRLAELERARQGDAGSLRDAVETLSRDSQRVRLEAANLASALRDNKVRGLWGEMQLRRVLDVSGMARHVDFVEQSGFGDSKRSGRPDVVVHLPNERTVVIDAKAPLTEFLKAADEADPAQRAVHTKAHADALAAHIKALSQRDYTDLVDGSVDFVVLFVPGDAFLTAALDARPELLEAAFGQDVVLAAPSTLLAFLRGVASGWQERQVTEQSEEIAKVGRELHQRVAVFLEHFSKLGTSLDRTVGSYNEAVGSLESRLLVSARRLEDLGSSSGRTLEAGDPIDERVRSSITTGQAHSTEGPHRVA